VARLASRSRASIVPLSVRPACKLVEGSDSGPDAIGQRVRRLSPGRQWDGVEQCSEEEFRGFTEAVKRIQNGAACKAPQEVQLAQRGMTVLGCLGEGAFARVFKARTPPPPPGLRSLAP
jgi:hypothetical protein